MRAADSAPSPRRKQGDVDQADYFGATMDVESPDGMFFSLDDAEISIGIRRSVLRSLQGKLPLQERRFLALRPRCSCQLRLANRGIKRD
jgi:hypothetical protein